MELAMDRLEQKAEYTDVEKANAEIDILRKLVFIKQKTIKEQARLVLQASVEKNNWEKTAEQAQRELAESAVAGGQPIYLVLHEAVWQIPQFMEKTAAGEPDYGDSGFVPTKVNLEWKAFKREEVRRVLG